MPKELGLWCIVPGLCRSSVFHLHVDENQTVDDLKDKIKERMPNRLANADAYAPTLYKINIGFSLDDDYHTLNDKIFRGVYKFIHPKQELFPSGIISEYFKESDFSQLVIHILAEFAQVSQ